MKRYPITSFFILAILLGGGIIFLVYLGALPAQLALLSVLSASFSGILLTAILDGKTGVIELFRRVLIWRVGFRYWLFALLFLVPVTIFGSLLNPLFGGDPITTQTFKFSFNFLPMFLIFFLVAGLGQEFGWSGFLIPRLQAKHSALTSSLIRAGLGFLWHIPLLILTYFRPYAFPDFPYGGWMIQKGVLITVLVMASLTTFWSVLFTWIFNQTRGSLLLVAVLHGSEIWLAMLLPGLGINTQILNNYWGYGLVMFLTVLAIILITGPANLTRRHQRIFLPKKEKRKD